MVERKSVFWVGFGYLSSCLKMRVTLLLLLGIAVTVQSAISPHSSSDAGGDSSGGHSQGSTPGPTARSHDRPNLDQLMEKLNMLKSPTPVNTEKLNHPDMHKPTDSV